MTSSGFYFFPLSQGKDQQCLSAEEAGKHGADAALSRSPNAASPGNRFAAGCPGPPRLHQKAGMMAAKAVTGRNVLWVVFLYIADRKGTEK